MAVDYQHLLHYPIPEVRQKYTRKDTMLYALGIGLGADPMDEQQLRYVYEDGLRVLPTYPVVLGHPGFWWKKPDTGVDWVRIVHGEQGLIIHKLPPPEGELIGRTRVTGIVDKGAGKGILVDSVLLRNINLPPVLAEAIGRKKEREQEVERQRAELERVKLEQEQQVAQAQASRRAAEEDAKRLRILAEAKAYEISTINKAASGNPAYIQLQSLEALKKMAEDPAAKLYFMDSNAPSPLPLLNLGDAGR